MKRKKEKKKFKIIYFMDFVLSILDRKRSLSGATPPPHPALTPASLSPLSVCVCVSTFWHRLGAESPRRHRRSHFGIYSSFSKRFSSSTSKVFTKDFENILFKKRQFKEDKLSEWAS